MKSLSLALLLTLAGTFSAAAADVVTIKVGYGPGGGYDAYARAVADHLGRFLEGSPDVVVEYDPGAGSLKLARSMMVAPASDRITIATVASPLALQPVFTPDDTSFDPLKVQYIGTLAQSSSYCYTSKSSGITSFDQLIGDAGAKLGSTGRSSSTYIYPTAMQLAFGGKYQVVTGFKGGAEINLALDRGDIQARCGANSTSLAIGDLAERVNVVAEMGLTSENLYPEATFVLDRVEDPKTKAALALVFSSTAISMPFLMSPSATPEQVATLRVAFAKMVVDPDFLAEAKTQGVAIGYTDGAKVAEMIRGFAAADEDIKALARKMVE